MYMCIVDIVPKLSMAYTSSNNVVKKHIIHDLSQYSPARISAYNELSDT